MADVTVTNTSIEDFDEEAEVTVNDATEDVADTAQTFNIKPTHADYKTAIMIENGAGGALAWSIAAGDFWAATSALTGSVAASKREAIVLDSAKYKTDDGIIAITLTPASTKKLKTDHSASITVVELPK